MGGHGAREDRGDAVLGGVELALDVERGDVHPRVDDAADEARDLVAVEVELLRGERRAQERADLVADVGVVELRPRLEGGVELVVDFYADISRCHFSFSVKEKAAACVGGGAWRISRQCFR